MASIRSYKTKSGIRWKVSVYIGTDPKTGNKKYAVKGGKRTKREAIKEGKVLESLVASGDLLPKATTPVGKKFEEVYTEWLKHYRLTVRESSLTKTIDCFNLHILPAIGNMYVNRITSADMQKAVETWYDESTSFKRHYRHAKRILEYALIKGYITRNPCQHIILPATPVKPGNHAEYWDREQLITFFNCISTKRELYKFVLFRLLAYAGLRIGECLGLEWEDINLNKRTLDINKTLSRGLHGRMIMDPPKTRASKRIVPIDEDTVEWLRKWRHEQNDYMTAGYSTSYANQPVFTTRHNERYRLKVPDGWLRTIIRKNNLTPPISLHKFRKSYVSNLLIAGVPVSTVQKLVGHSDPKITLEIYAQVHKEQEFEAADKLAEYLKTGIK